MIPYGRQHITDADIEAVVAVLRSDFLTQGPVVPEFQKAVARACDAEHAVAVNSATSALHIACLALGLGPGDRLWTSPNTFVASANVGLYCGADVDFVDIDPRTYNLCADQLGRRLAAAERTGTLPKIVMPVHFAGQSCDMEAIHRLAQRYGFSIIEDASHAIGASYRGAPVGSCRYSDIAVFSFHPVKIITTGEGGMALTRSAELAQKMARLASHGVTRDPSLMTHAADGDWYYQQVGIGFNYRMTEMQAALGLSQLGRLGPYVDRRHEIARRYTKLLSALPVTLPFQSQEGRSALHLYPVWVDPARIDRRKAFVALREAGIGVNVHYIPVPSQPYYRDRGFDVADCPAAQHYYSGAISLPIYATLTDAQQDHVVAALAGALERSPA